MQREGLIRLYHAVAVARQCHHRTGLTRCKAEGAARTNVIVARLRTAIHRGVRHLHRLGRRCRQGHHKLYVRTIGAIAFMNGNIRNTDHRLGIAGIIVQNRCSRFDPRLAGCKVRPLRGRQHQRKLLARFQGCIAIDRHMHCGNGLPG